MNRRFFLGFASEQPCAPGETVTITTKHDWPRSVRAGRLAIPSTSTGFDVLCWHIGDKPQCPRSSVPAALYLGSDGFLDGDAIRPGATVSLTVMNRNAQALYFGAGLQVEEIDEPEPEVTTAPNGAQQPPQNPPSAGPGVPPDRAVS